jgi:hypothetical protein
VHLLVQAILLLEALPAAAAPLLAKLHSNRAAARLMRHAPREALADCAAALQVRSVRPQRVQCDRFTSSVWISSYHSPGVLYLPIQTQGDSVDTTLHPCPSVRANIKSTGFFLYAFVHVCLFIQHQGSQSLHCICCKASSVCVKANGCTFMLQANAAYTRAAVRGATCHLRLGDFAAAAAMLRASQPHAATPAAARELADKLQEAEQLQAAYGKVGHSI